MNRPLYTTNLTGVKMTKHKQCAIAVGDVLSVHRRPDNTFDNQAMSVHFGPSVVHPQVGWVPAKEFEDKIVKGVLFNLASYGGTLEAWVDEYDSERHHLRVTIGLAPDACIEPEGGIDDEDLDCSDQNL